MDHFLANDVISRKYFGDDIDKTEQDAEIKRLDGLIDEALEAMEEARRMRDYDLVLGQIGKVTKLCEQRQDVERYGV